MKGRQEPSVSHVQYWYDFHAVKTNITARCFISRKRVQDHDQEWAYEFQMLEMVPRMQ